MQKSTTAALLSAFVFPGIGHLYLRSYVRGLLLLSIAAIALTDFIRRAWHEANLIREQLIDEINAGGIIDLEVLITQAQSAVAHIDRQPFTTATLILFVCWIIAIIDSYQLGRKLAETPPAP